MGVPNDLSWRWTGEHSVFPPGRASVAEASLARKTDAATPATRPPPPLPMLLFFFAVTRLPAPPNKRSPAYRFLFKCLSVSRNTVPVLYATGKDPDARGDINMHTQNTLLHTILLFACIVQPSHASNIGQSNTFFPVASQVLPDNRHPFRAKSCSGTRQHSRMNPNFLSMADEAWSVSATRRCCFRQGPNSGGANSRAESYQ